MADTYCSLADIARHHGVSKPAVSKWSKHPKWPGGKLLRAKVDAFVRQWIAPNRRGAKVSAPVNARVDSTSAADSSSAALADGDLSLPKTLEELERAIRSAKSPEEANLLAAQVRGLKGLQDVRRRDGELVEAEVVRRGTVAALHAFKIGCLNLPAQLAPKLANLPADEVQPMIELSIRSLLAELQRSLESIGAGGIRTAAA